MTASRATTPAERPPVPSWYRFVIDVPGLFTCSEDNAHESHWKKAARSKEQKRVVLLALDARSVRCPFPLPIRVTLTRLSFGTLDEFDNLPGSLKHVADAVAWWARGKVGKIGQADRDARAIRFVARQEKCPKGQRGVRIQVEGVTDGE